ncbi:MAG: PKD domain-containing protein, partial [Anaerolineae bacterium]|nr:PKD domain-containing protein [Anaerolineae bacterium]
TVNRADTTTTITADEPDPSVVGQSVTVSVTVAAVAPGSGTPTGVVSVTATGGGNPACQATLSGGSGACSLVFPAAGPVTLNATYGGDANFNGSSDTEAHTVNRADTTTTITADEPDPSVVGQSVTVSVTVAAVAPGSGTPTGVVSVTATGGGNPACQATLSGGSGACSLVFTAAGPVTLTATYGGDANFNGSSDTEGHTVNLPTLVANFITFPSPASILVGDTVLFTDTSTTDGPPIVAWAWDFGDGSVSAARHPTHTYTSVGVFTVTLVVTDALGYSDSEVKPNLVTVSPRCIALSGVTFTYTPPSPVVHAPVVFTATHEPADATQPVTYTWDFGDGGTGIGAVVQHTYTVTGTRTVSVNAFNPCTPAGVAHQKSITIAPRRIFLPLVLRNYR